MLSFHHIKVDDNKFNKFISILIPKPSNASSIKSNNIDKIQEDIRTRYYETPDLSNMEQTGYRFINAISDHETHFTPFRSTNSYQENLFLRTMKKPVLLDKSFMLLKEVI